MACIAEEYESERPAHPDRAFSVEPVEHGGAGIDAAVRDMADDE